jgi:hypothetical protein
MGEHRIFGGLTLVTGFSVGALALGALRLGLGISGVAMCSAVVLAISHGIFLPVYSMKKLGVTWRGWWSGVGEPVAMASAPTALLLYGVSMKWQPATWGGLIGMLSLSSVGFLLSIWLWGQGKEEFALLAERFGINVPWSKMKSPL